MGLLVSVLNFPYRDAAFVNTFFIILFLGGLTYPTLRNEISNSGLTVFNQVICFIFFGYLFYQYGLTSARIVVALGNKSNVEFKYHNKAYSTGSKMIFVGETQSTLFIFNKVDSSTMIFPRSAIDSLVILNQK